MSFALIEIIWCTGVVLTSQLLNLYIIFSKHPVSLCHCFLLKSELFHLFRPCTYYTFEVQAMNAFAFELICISFCIHCYWAVGICHGVLHTVSHHSRWKAYRQKEIYVREQLEILNRVSPAANTKLYLNNQNGFEKLTYSCLQISKSNVFLRSWSVLYCFLDDGQ